MVAADEDVAGGHVIGGEGEVGVGGVAGSPVGVAVLGADVEEAVLAEGRVGHHEVHGELRVRRDLQLLRVDDLPDRREPVVGEERVRRHGSAS